MMQLFSMISNILEEKSVFDVAIVVMNRFAGGKVGVMRT
jgi:hypothetical protein